MRSNWLKIALLAAGTVFSSCSFAWSENGHQTVGAIADILIHNTNAETQVQSVLGTINGQQLTLSEVSVWADCARSVKPGGDFPYDPGKFHIQACSIFEDDAGKAAMSDYARRNNSNCPYEGKRESCHKSYHFADIDIEHDSYAMTYVGSHDYDVIHAIDAAIAVLQDKPCPTPFSFASKKEALMLLVHFVGDLHQPLHVGAIYLDPADGSIIDPDAGKYDNTTDTAGGNFITGTGGVLHTQWDKTKFDLTDNDAMQALASQAKRIGTNQGDIGNWAVIWAGDTIVEAQEAFNGITYGPKTKSWPATYEDRQGYVHQMEVIQKRQIIKGGARLAMLLEAIWP